MPDELDLPTLLGSTGNPQPSNGKVEEALARMAIWPDHIMPGGKRATGPSHYLDIGLFEGPTTTANRCAAGCVTELITTLIANIHTNSSITEATGLKRTFPPDRDDVLLMRGSGALKLAALRPPTLTRGTEGYSRPTARSAILRCQD